MSEIALATERLRVSKLEMSGPLVTRLIHYNNVMCWAFERLRVVREYRSPRTIQAFSKVLVFLIPIVLSPYYVHIGHDPNEEDGPTWAPYYIAILVSFVLGSLQAVEDALDDPFDGISEDDINLDQLQDWSYFALIVSPSRSLRESTADLLPDSDNEHVTGARHSLSERNQADSHQDLEQLRKQGRKQAESLSKQANSVDPSAVTMDIQQQCDEEIEYPPVMSNPADLSASMPVELDPLDMEVDSVAWSLGLNEKTIQDLRTQGNETNSTRERERSLTPGSTAALRKKLASRDTTKQHITYDETSLSSKSFEEQTTSPLSASSFLGSPTFDSNVSHFRSKRQPLLESDPHTLQGASLSSGQTHRNKKLTPPQHALNHPSSHYSQSPSVPAFMSAEGSRHSGSVGIVHGNRKDQERAVGQNLSANQYDDTETEV
jgi:hypothetical protein